MSVRLGNILIEKQEVKRAFVEEGSIVVIFKGPKTFEMGGTKKISDTLKIRFKTEDQINEAMIALVGI